MFDLEVVLIFFFEEKKTYERLNLNKFENINWKNNFF